MKKYEHIHKTDLSKVITIINTRCCIYYYVTYIMYLYTYHTYICI